MNKHPTPEHYQHRIGGVLLDPYRIARVYGMADDALFSALKKILAAGKRGAKDKAKDVQDAIDALVRWQEMEAEDENPMVGAPESLDAPMTATEVVELQKRRVSPDPAARIAELERERDSARVDYVQAVRERDEAWSVVRNIGPILGFREGERVVDEAARVAARIAELERELSWIRDHTRKHLADEVLRQGAPVVWRDEKGGPVADYYYNKPPGVDFWLAPWDWQAFPPPFNNEPDNSLDAVADRECERFIAELERERDEARERLDRAASMADVAEASRQELSGILAAEREAHEATRREMDRVVSEVTGLRKVLDRYRPRRQSEDPAPDGVPIMRWNATTMRWQPSYGYELRPADTWTHQPPAPGEGEGE